MVTDCQKKGSGVWELSHEHRENGGLYPTCGKGKPKNDLFKQRFMGGRREIKHIQHKMLEKKVFS